MFDKVYLGNTLISKIMLGDTNIKYGNNGNEVKTHRLFASRFDNIYELNPNDFSIINNSTNDVLFNKAKKLVGGYVNGGMGIYWHFNGYSSLNSMFYGGFNVDDYSIIFEGKPPQYPAPYKATTYGGGQKRDKEIKQYIKFEQFVSMGCIEQAYNGYNLTTGHSLENSGYLNYVEDELGQYLLVNDKSEQKIVKYDLVNESIISEHIAQFDSMSVKCSNGVYSYYLAYSSMGENKMDEYDSQGNLIKTYAVPSEVLYSDCLIWIEI